MPWNLRTTGTAEQLALVAKCTMLIAVDPDTGLLRDFCSAPVTADMTQTGLIYGSRAWGSNTRGWWRNGASATLLFGANKPQWVYNGGGANANLAVFAAVRYSPTGAAGFHIGRDGGGSPDGMALTASGLRVPRLGSVANLAFTPTSGTDYAIAGLFRDHADNIQAIYGTPGGSTVGPTTVDTMGDGAQSFGLDSIGGFAGGTLRTDDHYCVAMFRTTGSTDPLTAAEFNLLRDDWFGTLLQSTGGDTTAPTLSSASATVTGATTATLAVTTDEGNGTLFAVVTTSATAPTAAQVRAGQNNAGASAVYAGNQAITSTGAKTFGATGLAASTTYFAHFTHLDAANNDSAVVSTTSFTTNAANVAPSITTQPTNQTATAPATASFGVVASGSPTPTYQWQRSTDSGATWSNISGATGSTFVTPATSLTGGAANNGDLFRCVASNVAGTVTSAAATLTVQTVPSVTTQPANQSVVAGATATFSVVFSGSPTPTRQWQRSTDGGASWSNISGATGASYSTPATTVSGGAANNGDLYRVVGTNAAGTITSTAAALTVSASGVAPTVTQQPANAAAAVGGTATFTANFAGTPTPTVQWQISTDGGSTWSNISGATGLSYTTPAVTLGDNGEQFRAVATNSAGSITTTAATLTVNSFTVSAGPCFRNTGDGLPIVTGPLSFSLIYGQIGAYAGQVSVDGTTNPNGSTGLITISGLPLAGAADLLIRDSDGSAVFYQRVNVA